MATEPPTPRLSLGFAPHINVEGAAEAAAFYTRVFGATEIARVAGPDNKLAFCHLRINGGSLIISDCTTNTGFELHPLHSYTMHVLVEDVDTWWRRALEAGGEVAVPLSQTPWGGRGGKFFDPFGVCWSLGTGPKRGKRTSQDLTIGE